MANSLIAEIVTTGTEILLGDIVDTNAAWIAQLLREAGINLYFKTTVGDNEPRLRGVIQQGMGRSGVIIVTGGLGPTVDDITRQAIANATGCRLVLHEGALATLQARFARFGAQMTENNLQQVYIPEGAILIENPVGTAPGFIVETGHCVVIALPGVPREMKHLMTESVLPYLRSRAGDTGIIRRRILRTFGIGESNIDYQLGELMHSANPTIGLAAHMGQADVRITARATIAEEAERLIDTMEQAVRARIGQYIYSNVPGEAYETVLVRRLAAAGISVAILETNTRGTLAERLRQALPDHNPAVLQIIVGVDPLLAGLEELAQPVSSDSQTAESLAMAAAQAIRLQSGAIAGVAVVGSAGADEGIFGSQNGATWVALDAPSGRRVSRVPFGGQDDYTSVRISNQALRMLWELTE